MRKKIETVLCWLSVLFGFLILGSCVYMKDGDWSSIDGILSAIEGILLGLVAVVVLLGWVYAYFVLRKDLRGVQSELAKLRASAGGAEQASPSMQTMPGSKDQ